MGGSVVIRSALEKPWRASRCLCVSSQWWDCVSQHPRSTPTRWFKQSPLSSSLSSVMLWLELWLVSPSLLHPLHRDLPLDPDLELHLERPQEELEYNRKLSVNAAYDYGYKVANDEKQTYMAHEETRKGADVQGKYNYVDANGDLVTVTYTAGVDGYNEERSVTPGAVTYRAGNIPAPWDGPLAGQTEVEVVPAPRAPAPRQPPRPAAPAIDQSALIRTILSQLQPQISSA